jgi:hypothetical protein
VEIKFIEVTHAVTYARGEVSPAGAHYWRCPYSNGFRRGSNSDNYP